MHAGGTFERRMAGHDGLEYATSSSAADVVAARL
jgi:hypothetical protein